jgi:hypothetical protein
MDAVGFERAKLPIYALLTDMKNKVTSLPLVDTWMAEGRIKLLSHISR